MEQKERHQLSLVAKVHFERIANGHLALNRIEVKMQSPGHAIVHHKGLSIRPVAQGLQDLRYVGTRLRSQAQDALLRHELRRNFDPVLLADRKSTSLNSSH